MCLFQFSPLDIEQAHFPSEKNIVHNRFIIVLSTVVRKMKSTKWVWQKPVVIFPQRLPNSPLQNSC